MWSALRFGYLKLLRAYRSEKFFATMESLGDSDIVNWEPGPAMRAELMPLLTATRLVVGLRTFSRDRVQMEAFSWEAEAYFGTLLDVHRGP